MSGTTGSIVVDVAPSARVETPAPRPRRQAVLGVLGIYLVTGGLLLPLYRYQLNPDGVSYLSIAAHYRHADWSETVNGLWSPMYSWLLVPFLAAGVEPLLAAHVLNLLAGLLALGGFWVLSARYSDRPRLRALGALIMVPVLQAWAFALVTPDLLLVALLLWYLVAICSSRYTSNLRCAVTAGLLGGAAYLAKGYAFPFFLMHFLGIHGWRMLRTPGERRRWVTRAVAGFGCFAALAAPWIVLISVKYGYPTQSTTMAYNWKLVGPAYQGQHPTYRTGLLPPTGPHAVSAWEDPTTLPMADWSATEHPGYFAKLVAGNVGAIVTTLQRFSLLALGILVLAVVVSRVRPGFLSPGERRMLQLTGFTIAVLVAGYTFVKLEPRYIWLCVPLLILAALLILTAAQRRGALDRTGLIVAAGTLAVSFLLPAAHDLAVENGTGAPNAAAIAALRQRIPDLTGARVASDAQPRSSMYLCYETSAHYYGLTPLPADEADRQLRAYRIRFVFHWGTTPPPSYLAGAEPVYNDARRGLTVYRLPAV